MTQAETIASMKSRARANFAKGFNCAECVFEAVLEHVETSLPKDVLKLATGFGGGVGLFGDTCGAIAGAVMAVGIVHGRSALPEHEDRHVAMKMAIEQLYGKPGLYRIFNQIPNVMKQKYGHTLCREITAQWQDQWLCRDHALHCREVITDAAGVAASLIYSDRNHIASAPLGSNVENIQERQSK